MKIGRIAQLVFVSFVVLSGRAETQPAENVAATNASQTPCSDHYTVEGGFRGGKTFRTFQVFPALDRENAIDRLSQGLASDNWQSVNVDRQSGIITTIRSLPKGRGTAIVPQVNIIVKKEPADGIRIELSSKSEHFMRDDGMKKYFCRILGFVNQG